MSRSGAAPQVRTMRSLQDLRDRLTELGVSLPLPDASCDLPPGDDSPPGSGRASALAESISLPLGAADPGRSATAANRFAILPMEGWDATAEGRPTELVRRRWQRFGASGAALIWGGEAVAVRHDGRANPHQLRIGPDTVGELAELRRHLVAARQDRHAAADTSSSVSCDVLSGDSSSVEGFVVGLQLTHSGRFARPEGIPAPRVAYRHPILDRRVGVEDDSAVLTDTELDDLVAGYVVAAGLAAEAGFDFVDVKCCHGYLGHELLSTVDRPGPYGGDLAGRSRFLRLVIEGIHRDVPTLGIGVRISAFDLLPYRPGPSGLGEPEPWSGPYPYAFGGDGTGEGIDLTETAELVGSLVSWGVPMVCVSAGSPYTNPHVQRPAYFPPSDGYTPPEDPLVGVARQLEATAALKARVPEAVIVGSGYSYLQEWLGPVADAAVAAGEVDLVGLGRVALSYPDLPADLLAGAALQRRQLCRTFSDCTTGPRAGVISGCYPLDPDYRNRAERRVVAEAKQAMPGRPARSGGSDSSAEPGMSGDDSSLTEQP